MESTKKAFSLHSVIQGAINRVNLEMVEDPCSLERYANSIFLKKKIAARERILEKRNGSRRMAKK